MPHLEPEKCGGHHSLKNSIEKQEQWPDTQTYSITQHTRKKQQTTARYTGTKNTVETEYRYTINEQQ